MLREKCNLCAGDKTEVLFANQNKDEISYLVKCSSCGLIFLYPLPNEKEISTSYGCYVGEFKPQQLSPPRIRRGIDKLLFGIKEKTDKAILRSFFGYPDSNPNATRLLIKKIFLFPWYLRFIAIGKDLNIIPYSGAGKLLDVGFGNATYLLKFKQQGWQVYGIDSEPKVVEDAKNRFGLEVATCNFKDYKCKDDYFDVVYMSHVLEHMRDPKGALNKTYLILKQGGTLVLKLPNIESFEARTLKNNWPHLSLHKHLYQFTPKTIKALLRSTGFKKISIKFELWHIDLLKNIFKNKFNTTIIDNKFTLKISKFISFILGYLRLGRVMVIFCQK